MEIMQDTSEENEDQTTIMLKIDPGSDNLQMSHQTVNIADAIAFSDDNLETDVPQPETNTELIRTSTQLVGTSTELDGTSSELVGTSSELVGTSSELVGTSVELAGTSVELAGTSVELTGFDSGQMVLHQDQGTHQDNAVTGTFVADAVTLQSLIASGAVQITDANGQPLQFVTLNTDQPTSEASNSVVSNITSLHNLTAGTSVVNSIIDHVETSDTENGLLSQLQTSNAALDVDTITRISLLSGPPPEQNLPPGTPAWAARLRDCQKIGDFYRGWLSSEVELDLVLTLHKQQTQTMWGTRQSPCPSKPATRLMWKSQYVPFDGMPFLNAGSRAIVMECQYGPRRKGSTSRKDEMAPLKSDFKQTCPARIYIKKVKKFLEYQVTVDNDKKTTKAAMYQAFQLLKDKDYEGLVQERYYVQLPVEAAHEFHILEVNPGDAVNAVMHKQPPGFVHMPSRVHPLVADKIRDMVAKGETRLYAIRKQIRKFVDKEMFEAPESVPDRHNLAYFPTVNDLQNHIHQAIKDIENGALQAQTHSIVNIELVGDSAQLQNQLQQGTAAWQTVGETPHAETVTVTLTQEPGEEGHMISKVETNLSDGSTQVSDNLTPETARLLSKLHPQMFSGLSHGREPVHIQIPQDALAAAATESQQAADSLQPHVTTATVTTAVSAAPTVIAMASMQQPASSAVPVPPVSQDTTYTMVQTESGALLLTSGSLPQGQGVYTVDSGQLQALSQQQLLQGGANIVQVGREAHQLTQAVIQLPDGTVVQPHSSPGSPADGQPLVIAAHDGGSHGTDGPLFIAAESQELGPGHVIEIDTCGGIDIKPTVTRGDAGHTRVHMHQADSRVHMHQADTRVHMYPADTDMSMHTASHTDTGTHTVTSDQSVHPLTSVLHQSVSTSYNMNETMVSATHTSHSVVPHAVISDSAYTSHSVVPHTVASDSAYTNHSVVPHTVASDPAYTSHSVVPHAVISDSAYTSHSVVPHAVVSTSHSGVPHTVVSTSDSGVYESTGGVDSVHGEQEMHVQYYTTHTDDHIDNGQPTDGNNQADMDTSYHSNSIHHTTDIEHNYTSARLATDDSSSTFNNVVNVKQEVNSPARYSAVKRDSPVRELGNLKIEFTDETP